MEMPSFDELARLAKEEPENFEALRQQLIEAAIGEAPEDKQRRLRGLQFQVDMERRRSRTPMAACLGISKMMHDSLFPLGQTLNAAAGEEPDPVISLFAEERATAATILSFPMQSAD